MTTTYSTIQALIAAEHGNKGHVLYSPGVEILNTTSEATYRLEDVSSPVNGARKDVIGWFDGETMRPINRT